MINSSIHIHITLMCRMRCLVTFYFRSKVYAVQKDVGNYHILVNFLQRDVLLFHDSTVSFSSEQGKGQ